MTPPRKENTENHGSQKTVWKKIPKRKIVGMGGSVMPFVLHTKLLDVISIVENYFQADNPAADVSERVRFMAIAMLGVATNEIGKRETPLLEHFLIDLGGLEENRAEIISSMLKRVSKNGFPCKLARAKVVFRTLATRTKLLGDKFSKILGITNLLSDIKYSLATFLMALFSSVVVENTGYFEEVYSKFAQPDEFKLNVIESRDFNDFVRFMVITFISCEKKAIEINKRKRTAREEECLRKLTVERLIRRDSLHASVDKIYLNKVKEIGDPQEIKELNNVHEQTEDVFSEMKPHETEQLPSRHFNNRERDRDEWVYYRTKIHSSQVIRTAGYLANVP